MLPFTLQQLRILKAIATEQSFTKAAKLLYLSQPTLSKQIRILEENLDMILINRENHKICFTENGQVFLQYAERILALCEESCRALIDLKNGERGNLIETVGIINWIVLSTDFDGDFRLINVLSQFSSSISNRWCNWTC
jgi:DNA-binding transcriptional LysR family regulator